MLFLPEPFIVFYYDIWSCDSVAMTCDILLTPDPSSKNSIDWKKYKRKEKKNKIEFNLCISNT